VNEEKGDRQKALRTLSRLIRRLFQRYRPKADIRAGNYFMYMLRVGIGGGAAAGASCTVSQVFHPCGRF
jgi:hypothetical protein